MRERIEKCWKKVCGDCDDETNATSDVTNCDDGDGDDDDVRRQSLMSENAKVACLHIRR